MRGRTIEARSVRGVTLVEVVLATGIAALFLTAFMVQYRVQQASFQVASDELRLPVQGYATANRMLGDDGFLPVFRPTTTDSVSVDNVFVRPGEVQMPVKNRIGSQFRRISFQAVANDPRPAGARPGGIIMWSGGPIVELSGPNLVATMSFFSPEIATASMPNGPGITVDSGTGSFTVKIGSTTAFYILGAAYWPSDVVGVDRFLTVAKSGERWGFVFMGDASRMISKSFSPGATFVLDGSPQNAGVLTCTWPITAGSAAGETLRYQLRDNRNTRRIGFWLDLNTSPYTGAIEIRDSSYLRN